MRITILVTHLMGSGHLVRALAIARAIDAAGGSALVISGGRPLAHVAADGVRLAQAPAVASNGLDYKTLLTGDGARASLDYLAERSRRIAALIGDERPDILVTELFPFGRRILAAEFEAAIAAARAANAKVRIAASIRDVLEPPSGPARIAETLARLDAEYDLVLVHGDPTILPLSESWPAPERLDLRYTGYVATPPPPIAPEGPGEGEVLVSVGGGRIGRALLGVAARAAALSPLRWRLLVGGADAAAIIAGLRHLGPAVVEAARPDYREMLQRAALSISLAGYNTAVEAALSPAPAILVPMEEGGEREQLIRAAAFARLPGVSMLRIGGLAPEALADAARDAMRRPRISAALNADGAAETARMLLTGV
jgi:predicted glycosyltransferase